MKKFLLISLCAAAISFSAQAQTADTEKNARRIAELERRLAKVEAEAAQAKEEHKEDVKKHNRLQIGGYGEAAYSRNFYSDSPFKYTSADITQYKDDPSHGRFDIPHAVIYLNYDFGKGWKLGTEIEFEHGGTGGAVEKEGEEGGEWEVETEKGGEVELEQFWLQKTFFPELNIRAGHIVVPVGLTNAYHEPLNFFTVYRPEGESTILPCTWHQTGVSIWGNVSNWLRYEAQLVSGLDANMFDRTNWIGKGAQSPYEFEVANKYGFVGRLDFYIPKGPRIGLSGYYGQTMHNSFPHDMESDGQRYKDIKGKLYLGAIDFTYNDHNVIARGSADYGYISSAKTISQIKFNQSSGSSPYRRSEFGSHAIAISGEVGYDVFSFIRKVHEKKQKLYVFAHAEYYDSFADSRNINKYTKKVIYAGGLNYYPIPQIAVKAEYNYRKLDNPYYNEPSINIGVTYQGFFLK